MNSIRYCPHCGEECGWDHRFCQHCRAELPQVVKLFSDSRDAANASRSVLWEPSLADLKDGIWLVGEYDGNRWFSTGVVAMRGDPPFPAHGTQTVSIQSAMPVNPKEVAFRYIYADQSGQEYVVLYNPPAWSYAVVDRRFFKYVNRCFPRGSWWYDARMSILSLQDADGKIEAVISCIASTHDSLPALIRNEIDELRAHSQLTLHVERTVYYVDSHSIDPGT